jgi:hypothetical protein
MDALGLDLVLLGDELSCLLAEDDGLLGAGVADAVDEVPGLLDEAAAADGADPDGHVWVGVVEEHDIGVLAHHAGEGADDGEEGGVGGVEVDGVLAAGEEDAEKELAHEGDVVDGAAQQVVLAEAGGPESADIDAVEGLVHRAVDPGLGWAVAGAAGEDLDIEVGLDELCGEFVEEVACAGDIGGVVLVEDDDAELLAGLGVDADLRGHVGGGLGGGLVLGVGHQSVPSS